MRTNQVILIITCICLLLGLFFFGERKKPFSADTKSLSTTSSENSSSAKLNEDRLIQNLKQKISPEGRDSLSLYEQTSTNAKSNSDKASALLKQANIWEKERYLEIGALIYRKAAKIDSTELRWQSAADRMNATFRISEDSTLRAHLVEGAINSYEKTLAFDTSNVDNQVALASCYIDGYPGQTQVMQGVLKLIAITKKDSTHLSANLLLGRMAIVSGQLDKAIIRFNRVIRHQPSNSEAFYFLGEAYLAQGKKEKAIDAFKQCKKLTKNATFATELDNYISKIINS